MKTLDKHVDERRNTDCGHREVKIVQIARVLPVGKEIGDGDMPNNTRTEFPNKDSQC